MTTIDIDTADLCQLKGMVSETAGQLQQLSGALRSAVGAVLA